MLWHLPHDHLFKKYREINHCKLQPSLTSWQHHRIADAVMHMLRILAACWHMLLIMRSRAYELKMAGDFCVVLKVPDKKGTTRWNLCSHLKFLETASAVVIPTFYKFFIFVLLKIIVFVWIIGSLTAFCVAEQSKKIPWRRNVVSIHMVNKFLF